MGESIFVGTARKSFPSKFIKDYAKTLKLEEKARELLKQPDGRRKFRERYGTHFVCGIVNQASFTVSISKEQANFIDFKKLTFQDAVLEAWSGQSEKLSKEICNEIINLSKIDRSGEEPNSPYHMNYDNLMKNLRNFLEVCKEGQPIFYISCLYDTLEDFQKCVVPDHPHHINEVLTQEIYSDVIRLEYYKMRFSVLTEDEQNDLSGVSLIFEELTDLVHSYKLFGSRQQFKEKLNQIKQLWNDYAKKCHEIGTKTEFEPKRNIYAWMKKSKQATEEQSDEKRRDRKSKEHPEPHSYSDISTFSPKNDKAYHEDVFLFGKKANEEAHLQDVSDEAYKIVEKDIQNYLKEIQQNIDVNMTEKVRGGIESQILEKLSTRTNTYDNLNYDIENLIHESDIKTILAQIQLGCLQD